MNEFFRKLKLFFRKIFYFIMFFIIIMSIFGLFMAIIENPKKIISYVFLLVFLLVGFYAYKAYKKDNKKSNLETKKPPKKDFMQKYKEFMGQGSGDFNKDKNTYNPNVYKSQGEVIKNENTVEVTLVFLEPKDIPTNEFVVVDLETTGLNPVKDNIIEIGAIRVNLALGLIDKFQRFIKIDKKLSNFIINYTGITDEILKRQGVRIDIAMREFKNFARELPLVGHNIRFDAEFLLYDGGKAGVYITNDLVDTLYLSRRCFRNIPDYKLTTLIHELGINESVAHRALGDCEMTLRLYEMIIPAISERIRAEEERDKEIEFFDEFIDRHKHLLKVVAYFVKADNIFTKKEKKIVFEFIKQFETSKYATYDNINKKIFNRINDFYPNENELKESIDKCIKKYDIEFVTLITNIVELWKSIDDESIKAMKYINAKFKDSIDNKQS